MKTDKIPSLGFGQMTTIAYLIIIILAIYVAITLLKRLGLLRSTVERKAAKAKEEVKAAEKNIQTTVGTSQLFDPKYYKTQPLSKQVSEQVAKLSAAKIHSAWGFLNDDEDAIYGAFRNLTNKVQVSQIADQYYINYNEDLAGRLIDALSKSELNKVYSIIAQLPD